jgi:hypothetical protein
MINGKSALLAALVAGSEPIKNNDVFGKVPITF